MRECIGNDALLAYHRWHGSGLSLRKYIDPGGIYILIKILLKIHHFQNVQIYWFWWYIYIGAGGIYISSLQKIQTSNMLVQYIDNNQYINNIR